MEENNEICIAWYAKTNKVGSRVAGAEYFDRELWDSWTEEQREEAMKEVVSNA